MFKGKVLPDFKQVFARINNAKLLNAIWIAVDRAPAA